MATSNTENLIKEFVNRKATHEYHFIDLFEAGIKLLGSEIK